MDEKLNVIINLLQMMCFLITRRFCSACKQRGLKSNSGNFSYAYRLEAYTM